MNDPHRRARRERHLRDRSQAMLDRFVERRNRNQRYDNWLERNGLEPGYDHRRSRKPDPVKVKQGIKRETGIYLGQAAHAMENGGIMTAARLDTGSSVQTADCFDTSLRTGYIPSSSPQSSSDSSCRHGSDGTSRSPSASALGFYRLHTESPPPALRHPLNLGLLSLPAPTPLPNFHLAQTQLVLLVPQLFLDFLLSVPLSDPAVLLRLSPTLLIWVQALETILSLSLTLKTAILNRLFCGFLGIYCDFSVFFSFLGSVEVVVLAAGKSLVFMFLILSLFKSIYCCLNFIPCTICMM